MQEQKFQNNFEQQLYNFLQDNYQEKLLDVENKGKDRLTVDFKDLQLYVPNITQKILNDPAEYLERGEKVIKQITGNRAVWRIKNAPESTERQIRKIRHDDINKLITIEGTIAVATDVYPSVVRIKYECRSCGNVITTRQKEQYIEEPSGCTCGSKNRFNRIGKELVDKQRLVIEEDIENLEISDQPKKIDVVLTQGLTAYEIAKYHTPGNKIKITGVLQELPENKKYGKPSQDRKFLLHANHVEPIELGFKEINISKDEKEKIKKLSQQEDILERLVDNYAPNIYGNREIKKTIVLQQFGGNTVRDNEGRIEKRGHIHILLIGDPGSGKTGLIKKAFDVTPKARYTSGATSTAAGLTATVDRDESLGTWTIQAGVLVLANGGVCIIDEFDKAREEDMGALHEAMSEGTVSVNKANIHATLPSETNVLAAANPKHGRFDPVTPPAEQLNIGTALLSRFDFVHIFRDETDEDRDKKIMRRMIDSHKGESLEPDNKIPKELMKKYIAYAKRYIQPEFTEQSEKLLLNTYAKFRQLGNKGDEIQTVSITPRYGEALIRVSQAAAKARLSEEIEEKDVEVAAHLIKTNLERIALDPETGKIDIDRLTLGESTKNRNLKQQILRIIREKGDGDPVSEQEIIDAIISTSNNTEEKIEKTINKLKQAGDIFEPESGKIQRIT